MFQEVTKELRILKKMENIFVTKENNLYKMLKKGKNSTYIITLISRIFPLI